MSESKDYKSPNRKSTLNVRFIFIMLYSMCHSLSNSQTSTENCSVVDCTIPSENNETMMVGNNI